MQSSAHTDLLFLASVHRPFESFQVNNQIGRQFSDCKRARNFHIAFAFVTVVILNFLSLAISTETERIDGKNR
jgi:hypothetical protein